MPQAKVFTPTELRRVLDYVATRPHAQRNRAMLLCSHWAGMRVNAGEGDCGTALLRCAQRRRHSEGGNLSVCGANERTPFAHGLREQQTAEGIERLRSCCAINGREYRVVLHAEREREGLYFKYALSVLPLFVQEGGH